VTAPVEVDVDPFSDEFLTDPFPHLARIRQAAPVVFLPAYGVYATASHAQVHAVLRDHEHFSSAAGVGLANIAREQAWRKPSILLEVDPPVHTHNRAVVATVMSPKALRSLQDVFDAEAASLADELVSRASFDAVRDLAEVFPTVVFPKAFGVEADTRQPLLAYGAMVFNGHGPRNHLFDEAMAGAEGVLEWIASQCERSALRPGSIGTDVYAAADEAGVSEAEAGLLIRSFLSAGIDTTVSAIAYGIGHFASRPDQWQLVRDEEPLARNAFEEVVRLESPVMGFFRTTTGHVELAGARLPADAKVLVFFAGANRDPARWERPDEFDVRRRVVGHMGYGIGAHACLGMVIARMQGEALFRALGSRVARFELTGPPVPRLNNTLRCLGELPVTLTPA
jgi:4-methoxybenzoate monooxygenase (O-demethylating)